MQRNLSKAALTRARHSAVWAAREAADKADQHVLNLRQRLAELTRGSTQTQMAEEQRGFGEWQEAGGSWSSWQWDQPGDGVQAWWRDGSPWDGSRESQGCCVRAAARTVRCPSGLGSYDGRAAKHGCGGNGFAAGSCVGDACDAEHVQTEPRAVGDSVGACYAKSVPQEGGRPESGSPWCKVYLAQQIEDSEDELIAGPFSPMDERARTRNLCKQADFFVFCETHGFDGS